MTARLALALAALTLAGATCADRGTATPPPACRVTVATPTLAEDDFTLPPGCDFERVTP